MAKSISKIGATFVGISISVVGFAFGISKIIQDIFPVSPYIDMNMQDRFFYFVCHYGALIALGFYFIIFLNQEKETSGIISDASACLVVALLYCLPLVFIGK